MNSKIKPVIVMIGPSPAAQGGMAAVMNSYLNSELNHEFKIVPIFTRLEGSKFKKLALLVSAIWQYLQVAVIKSPVLSHIHFCSNVSFYRKSLFVLLARLSRQKIVFHAHGGGFHQFYQQSNPFARKFIRGILNTVDTIVTLSVSSQKKYARISGRNDILIIHNSVAESAARNNSPVLENTEVNHGCRVIFLGRIEREKGIYELIEAAALVKPVFPQTEFLLGGAGEIESAKLFCRQRGVEQMFDFRGWVQKAEKNQLLQQATCFVLPSYRELQSVAVLEAMAAGLPIVASNISGISEVVEDGVNGFLVPVKNSTALANRLLLILKNAKLRELMKQNNIKKFKKKYASSIVFEGVKIGRAHV